MEMIKNIFCVGRNFKAHAKELNNPVPTSPFLFSKPTHAIVEASGQVVNLPSDQGTIHYETELVLYIGKTYEKGMTVDEIVDCMAIGLDLTLRDVQNTLKEKRYPWLLAKGFPNSAILSKFIDFPGEKVCKETNFSLLKNEEKVQEGNIRNLIFDLQTLIDFCGNHFGLGKGDIIFTGTPENVGPLVNGDHLTLLWGDNVLGEVKVKIE
ncbi:fumarylacetoacetate hydrolase family protein [Fervidibacillus albus]|uniref:Fumarylacetoacetate hydrolase family protein n=1 Tax=Fervidibacillus albus TaxID=2980026 RepID=A0A9E8LX41_9BACI|nr:fumarylacetoacetate hydrolase family protein [Fervidibacillus albus]WAA11318.1 fumarylacetoacetate hydrolase family protein [Fervidibacillus albus]